MSDLLHNLLKDAGRHKRAQRIGRGEGSKGKTSGRGHKGAGARAGKDKRIGFEGGQTEIYRRFALRGFSNKPFETRLHEVNVSALNRFDDGATVDAEALKQAGLIPNTRYGVKVLGNGELTKKLTVVAAGYSRSAQKAITDKGGETQNEQGQPFEFKQPKNKRQARKLDKRLAALGLEPIASDGGDQEGESGGESAPATEAPESGEKDSGTQTSSPGSETESSDSVTEAPESGEKE